jgi:MFS family permease
MVDDSSERPSSAPADARKTAEVVSSEGKLKENTMRLSIVEGSFWALMQTFCDNYIVPFGLTLNMNDPQVGLLNAMTGIMPPFGQIIGSRLMEKHSRKGVLVAGVVLQACMLPLITLLALLFAGGVLLALLPVMLVLFYTAFTVFNAIGSPAWFSMMGDIVPNEQRGKYFSKRNMITTLVGLVATLAVAFVLDAMNVAGLVLAGLSIILLAAFSSRMTSAAILKRHYDPPFHIDKTDYVSLKQFFKELPTSNFGHFTLFVALINFAQMIAGPFFTPFMLQTLDFDYATFIVVNLASSFVALFMYPILGKYSDKVGNILMLRIGSLIIPFLPLMWVFMSDPLEIVLGPQLLGGVGWTMFNMAAFNFIFDSIDTHKRGYYLAYYNLLVGIGIFFGGILGGVISQLPISFMDHTRFLFLLSAIGRGIVVIIFLPRIKEVRHVDHHAHYPVFRFRSLSMGKNMFEVQGFEHWFKPREHVAKHRQHHWGSHWGFHKNAS